MVLLALGSIGGSGGDPAFALLDVLQALSKRRMKALANAVAFELSVTCISVCEVDAPQWRLCRLVSARGNELLGGTAAGRRKRANRWREWHRHHRVGAVSLD